MIIFDLICELEHRFEGWFKTSGDYDTQLLTGQLTCPVCGVNEIHKISDKNDLDNIIEIKPYNLVKEKLNISDLVVGSSKDVDVKALTVDFIDRLNDFVEQHFDDLGENLTADTAAIYDDSGEGQTIIQNRPKIEKVKVVTEDGISIIAIPEKKKKLN